MGKKAGSLAAMKEHISIFPRALFFYILLFHVENYAARRPHDNSDRETSLTSFSRGKFGLLDSARTVGQLNEKR